MGILPNKIDMPTQCTIDVKNEDIKIRENSLKLANCHKLWYNLEPQKTKIQKAEYIGTNFRKLPKYPLLSTIEYLQSNLNHKAKKYAKLTATISYITSNTAT